jgi:SAM-dependent methyltransferase
MQVSKTVNHAKSAIDQSELKLRWEERASAKGATLSSVLYRGFSERLNRYVHEWHVTAVLTELLPRLPRGALVLDLGCGYGRIRQAVANARPDLRIVGMDFSRNYCHMYAVSQNAETVCADMNHMPFSSSVFDGLMGITCLMYLAPEQRVERLAWILETLKPSGYALFIDPGSEFMQLARFGLPSTRKTTGGQGFRLREYRALGSNTRHEVYTIGAMPIFTALLPALYAAASSGRITEHLLRLAQRVDFATQRFATYSLQRWALLGPKITR